MNESGFKNLLSSVSGSVTVWTDFVPEKRPLPAIAYTHITNSGERLLKGSRYGLRDTWRVMVVAKTRSEYKAIIDAIKDLDNTSSEDFKNIFVISDGGIPSQPEDKAKVAYIDLRTYDA